MIFREVPAIIILDQRHKYSFSERCECFLLKSANQNYNEVSPHTSQNGFIKHSINNKYWRGCGEKGILLIVDENVNWCGYFGEQYGGSLKN